MLMRCFVRALISELVTDCCACFCCVCASGWEGLGWWGVNMAVCRWGEVLSGSALEPIRLKPSVHWGCWEKKKPAACNVKQQHQHRPERKSKTGRELISSGHLYRQADSLKHRQSFTEYENQAENALVPLYPLPWSAIFAIVISP